MCGAQIEMPGRVARPARISAAASSSDVAIGFSTSTCLPARERRARERPVLVHAGQDEHDVDVVALDHGLRAGQRRVETEAQPGCAALALVDVVDGGDARAAARREALDHAHVGAVEDASQPEHADPDGRLAHRLDASTGLESAPLAPARLTGAFARSS